MVTTETEISDAKFWYLDIGCSTHMTGRSEWFVNLNPDVKCKVKFVDDTTLTTEGVGRVLIKRKDGKHSYISDVLLVPEMKSNMLSLGQLLEKGYMKTMENKALKVFDDIKRLILMAPLSARKQSFQGGDSGVGA